jgi:hypothetical protein
MFAGKLSDNLYRLWNRLASGAYMPPPVKRVEIPKRDGGVRPLGIPTVGDRIAQSVVKEHLEKLVEPHFHQDSYGYRPGRSAHHAVERTRERCWRFKCHAAGRTGVFMLEDHALARADEGKIGRRDLRNALSEATRAALQANGRWLVTGVADLDDVPVTLVVRFYRGLVIVTLY